MKLNIGAYAKGITAVAFAVVTSLQPVYGGRPWFAGLSAGLGALAVILIPNAPKDSSGQAPAPKPPA